VTGLRVNGITTTRTWLPESFVANGGTVDFDLSATPDVNWGSAAGDAPPSFRDGEVGQRGFVQPARLVIPAGSTGVVEVGAQDYSGSGATVHWAATPPAGIRMSPSSGDIAVPPGARASVAITVQVEPGAAQTTHRVPVAFTGPAGALAIPIAFSSGSTTLASATFQVLAAEPGSLRAAFNNVGISPDDNMAVANYDQVGFSMSANALSAAGVSPGGTVTVDGIAHTWPNVPVADPDNVMVSGQTISLSGAPAGATRLAFLGSATNGNASGDLTITYTDGSTQIAQLGFSDWTLGGGGAQIAFDNRVAARMPYRNSIGGSPQTITTYVFATAPITLTAGKQIASVTLPSTVDGGALHIFAVTAS
jgi:hypothetical protein